VKRVQVAVQRVEDGVIPLVTTLIMSISETKGYSCNLLKISVNLIRKIRPYRQDLAIVLAACICPRIGGVRYLANHFSKE
jgi:hypothetical protein